MDQQLPQILFLSGRSPDPRKPPFHQQFQNQRRVAPVVFLGAHLTGANLRCISDPHVVPLCRGHFHKPLTVPGGLHPDKSRCGQLPIKPLGFSRPMLQLLFSRLSSDRVQPTNLLPTGVVITSNKHHRRLLSTEWLRSSNQKHTRPPIGAFALIQSILAQVVAVILMALLILPMQPGETLRDVWLAMDEWRKVAVFVLFLGTLAVIYRALAASVFAAAEIRSGRSVSAWQALGQVRRKQLRLFWLILLVSLLAAP